MRKQILSITAIAVAVALQSCGGEKAAETTEEPVEEVAEATPENWMIDTKSSMVMWEGGTSGAQVYSHNGNIAITEGSLVTTDGSVTAGKVVIDMTTIMPTDAESFSYSEQLSKEDLIFRTFLEISKLNPALASEPYHLLKSLSGFGSRDFLKKGPIFFFRIKIIAALKSLSLCELKYSSIDFSIVKSLIP